VSSPGRIRVWDLPTRLFHWSLAVLVVFSFTTGQVGGAWLEWHMRSGFAILALLLFRVVWGVAGSETARFAHFVRGPRTAFAYAREAWARRPTPSVGHNPLGGWMVLFMIAVLLAQATTGLFVDDEISTQGPLSGKVSNAIVAKMTAFHHFNQWTLAAAVALHVIAIAFYRMRFGTDLVSPMVSGWMAAPASVLPPQPVHRSPLAALALIALSAAFVYWLVVIYPRG
jgi:cytochrome b